MKLETGQKVLVYDPREWNKHGRDIGHNEHCWKEAIIENIRFNVPSTVYNYIYPILFDVRFLHDNFLSKGHFKDVIKKIS